MRFEATVGGRRIRVEVRGSGPRYVVTLDGRAAEVEVRETSAGFADILLDGASHEAGVLAREGGCSVLLGSRVFDVLLEEEGAAAAAPRRKDGGLARITAPMPGRLVKVLVETGQQVAEGQGLVVMEAMKMENELRAPRAGRVKELPALDRQAVESGALLVVLE